MWFNHNFGIFHTLPCYMQHSIFIVHVKTTITNGKGPMLLLLYYMFFKRSKSLIFLPPKLTFLSCCIHIHKIVYPVFLLELKCNPYQYVFHTVLNIHSKQLFPKLYEIFILPGFTFPGILILLPNRCEKGSCHTLLWWPQWFCALSKSSGFP